MINLIKALLGDSGAAAMGTLLETDLRSYIAPRAIVGWLKQVEYGDIQVPSGVPLGKLNKSGYGFSGSTLGEVDYKFQYACEEQVAAIILTSLGFNIGPSKTKNLDLAKLSKTIDALIKSQRTTRIPHEQVSEVTPTEHVPPSPKQTETKTQRGPVRIPGLRRSALKVSSEESGKKCQTCGDKMFKGDKFAGCMCYKSLAKNVTTSKIDSGYLLTVRGAEAEVISALIKDFK